MTRKLSYREAMREAMHEALTNDPRVLLMGEDVGATAAPTPSPRDFLEEFGPERIRDTPLSELGFIGAGIGASLGGLRPIVEVMTVNFSLLALDQMVNSAALLRHMSGGQFTVPLVIRMCTGALDANSRPSTRTASKAGMRTFPASRCWRPPLSRMRAVCSRRGWMIQTRW